MQKDAASLVLENIVVGLVMLVTAMAARAVGVPEQGIAVMWPSTALMFGYCAHRGPRGLPGAAIGIAVWAWFDGANLFSMMLFAAASTVPPWLTATLVGNLRRARENESNMRSTIRLMLMTSLIMAPMSALLNATAMADYPQARGGFLPFLAFCYLSELTSNLVLSPLGFLWLDKSGQTSERRRAENESTWLSTVRVIDWYSLAFVAVIVAACWMMHRHGMTSAARWLIFGVVFGPLFSSLSRSPRSSSLVLALSGFAVLTMRVHLYGNEPVVVISEGLIPAWLITSMSAILLHLLNALAVERWRQSRRVEADAMKSEVAGLASSRALHRYLLQLTGNQVRKPFRIVEIFIPEVLRAGELMGRTAMLELEAAAATQLQAQAGSRAALSAHLSTGRFALVLPVTTSDSRVQKLIDESLQSHSFKVSGRLFQLRPATGLIDVAVGARTHPEAVLAALSLAQQRAFTSAERFRKFPLDSRELKQVWAELDLEESVKRALHEKRIRLVAQLIAPCQRGSETIGLHYEVLARMVDDHGNILSPAAFLPAIARAGLTREFDRTVIEAAFDHLSQDQRLRSRTLTCAINVTGRTISSPELPAYLRAQLQRTGLSPRMFAIEITESESIDDIEVAKENARQIAGLGLTVAVDDFGTGLATFDYIKQFKPQMLKIDGSFIKNFDDSPLDRAIVQAIVRVAGTIGARTVAEWVETEDLGRKLRGLGVDFLQGYAIAKPVPIEQIAETQPDLSFLNARADRVVTTTLKPAVNAESEVSIPA